MKWRFTLVCYILTEQSRAALLDRREDKAGQSRERATLQQRPSSLPLASGASLASGHSSYGTASQHSLGPELAPAGHGSIRGTQPGAGPRAVSLTAKQEALPRRGLAISPVQAGGIQSPEQPGRMARRAAESPLTPISGKSLGTTW